MTEYLLVPCPCCRHPAAHKDSDAYDYGYRLYWAECTYCGLRTKNICGDDPHQSRMEVGKLWNRRLGAHL